MSRARYELGPHDRELIEADARRLYEESEWSPVPWEWLPEASRALYRTQAADPAAWFAARKGPR